MDNHTSDEHSPAMEEGSPPPPAEWLVAAIGLVLLVACLGYLGFQAFQPHTPPAPVVERLGIEAQQGRWLVRLRVHNQGTMTAERLRVAGQLRHLGAVVEERELEIDFLPGGSSREAGLFFTRDPSGAQLQLEARGYLSP
jgi:uncharacterized protein (TIGR02588 family)